MIDIIRKIKRGTILLYGTVLLAAGQSIFLHLITTDYAHEIISTYFMIEILILGITIILGLRNKWARIMLVILTMWETILFFHDTPLSPDNIVMIVVWLIRAYVISGLFTRTMNQYYKGNN